MTSKPLVLESNGNLKKGTNGHQCDIISNTFKLQLPDKVYYHYDRESTNHGLRDDITDMSLITRACSLYDRTTSAPLIFLNTILAGIRKWDRRKQQEGEQIKNPARTVAVIERLQTFTAPQEFNPRGVFDGVVNFFTLKNMSQSKVLAF